MKRILESDDAGFVTMLGEKVCVFCSVYIYTGVLSGVSEDHVELTEPKLVYDTGPLDHGEWKDAQTLPSPWRVQIQHIESWGPAKW